MNGHTAAGPLLTWATILSVAITAVAGDVLTAGAMRRLGDLDLEIVGKLCAFERLSSRLTVFRRQASARDSKERKPREKASLEKK